MIDKFGKTELGRYFYDPLWTKSNIFVRTDGSSTITSDFDFNSNKIINLAELTNSHDAATKYYVDTHVTGGTGTVVGAADLDLNFHKAINLNQPTSLHNAAKKNYVDVSTSLCV